MDYKGIEFSLTMIEPGSWRYRFQIGRAIKTGRTKTTLEPGAPQVLFAAPPLVTLDTQMYNYDVTADGQRFLLNTAFGGAALPPLNLILNWDAQLKK